MQLEHNTVNSTAILLKECKQKALVGEIRTMENTSAEAMPGHYVTTGAIMASSNQYLFCKYSE